MKEYIEREAVLGRITKIKNDFSPTVQPMFGIFEHMLSEAPAADVEPVIHGEWIGTEGDVCSECGASLSEIMDADSCYAIGFDPNQLVACPFCGAKMNRGNK